MQLYLKEFVESYEPTVEDTYQTGFIIDHQPCLLEATDIDGLYNKSLGHLWIQDHEGFILVYSITSIQSFQRIPELHRWIQETKPGDGGKASVVIVGDNINCKVSYEDGSRLARKLRCGFVETSAKSSHNVDKAFSEVVRSLRGQPQQCGDAQHDHREESDCPHKLWRFLSLCGTSLRIGL